MPPVSYEFIDTDGEVLRGKLYYDCFYHCYVRNKVVRLRDASGAFAVYMWALYEKSFCKVVT